ncbi:hypothetical protein EG329_013920 [Mollisiaceae sp. DMI_Dod_QoI]|nr:hypothetical protein EG329_013920 [Helotiales sp. DMI_Dod_QoI]
MPGSDVVRQEVEIPAGEDLSAKTSRPGGDRELDRPLENTTPPKPNPKYGAAWNEQWKWTLTHSYFANMGGFDGFIDNTNFRAIQPLCFILYRFRGMQSVSIPFPSRADIEDKGKADLLVKLFAILQISWLVLSVIDRGVMGLPVSQLEVATVAFSTIAIATYLCNLWKPKDVDMPINLLLPANPNKGIAIEWFNQVSFFGIIFDPPKRDYRAGLYKSRVSNDKIRMLGLVPLISITTAISTLFFGGLHCIAWSFDFPSKAESLIWRIASIISASLPCIALFGNIIVAKHTGNQRRSSLLFIRSRLENLGKYPKAWWTSFSGQSPMREAFREFLTASKELDNGSTRAELTPELLEIYNNEYKLLNTSESNQTFWDEMSTRFERLHKLWERSILRERSKLAPIIPALSQGMIHEIRSLAKCIARSPTARVSWKKYEDFVRAKIIAEGELVPEESCLEYLLFEDTVIYNHVMESLKPIRRRRAFSRTWTIFAGIFYAIARVALLIIAFTSLRSAPKELYVTSWTRFMPNVS